MSDSLRHECGIALIRLLKPLSFYEQKYGSPLYGFQKLFLLMEKQKNRGQDGAGIGAVKIGSAPGKPYMFRDREIKENALARIFSRQLKKYDKLVRKGAIIPEFTPSVKDLFEFGAELYIGHLRYGTSGEFTRSCCHPYFRRSNWPTKNLMVAGNFNLTNTDSLHQQLVERGQHPVYDTDTQSILEEIGFHLDEEHTALYRDLRDQGVPGPEIQEVINEKLDTVSIIHQAAATWDGAYCVAGLVGNGDAFVMRDPNGIRPCWYYHDNEIVAFASERVPLMTIFAVDAGSVREVAPGHVVVVKRCGTVDEQPFAARRELLGCSFERIYFSRGNDPDIYRERKALGAALCKQVLPAIDFDLDHAVFSFVPNTAEVAYHGLLEALHEYRRSELCEQLLKAYHEGSLSPSLIEELVAGNWPRNEKIAHKDMTLRTFINQEKGRSKLVSHVYDITFGMVNPGDTLVVLEDSIVRGTTLQESILKILSLARPKRIIILSTAPQIRYPDCYGIDMSELGKFIAFKSAIALLKQRGQDQLILDVYQTAVEELQKPPDTMANVVRSIYAPFRPVEISRKITELVYPQDIAWNGEILIIYQSIEDLHKAIPEHRGDWYFTGDYPTPGGYAVVNRAFVNYYENRSGRSYDWPAA